jgi:uncharacterized low-complexity protein
MRIYALAVAAAALLVVAVPASAQRFEIGPGGIRVYEDAPRGGYYEGRRSGGRCEELRLACQHKDRLGEVGEGNCRRYRETCLRPVRRDICAELRSACLYKDRLGEVGEGNCRRYRRTCRGE